MGKRGEGWVFLQILLGAAILLAPRIPKVLLPIWLRGLGGLILGAGLLFVGVGAAALGRNLTAVPKPVEGGELITSGPYAYARHPIYTGVILGALGWALLQSNLLGLPLAVVAFLFFDAKSRREEQWLAETYPAYGDYQRRVRKLIPWVY